ncbi:hypothetical protein GCM10028814_32690 [Angustibacter aerolatus]
MRLRRLAVLRPAVVRAARSAPPWARVLASRVLVAADLARLLEHVPVERDHVGRARWQRDVAQRREWLHGTVTLRRPDGSVLRQPHRLLWFDPAGDGTVVEALGDVERAEHLAVFVPGTGSDLHREGGAVRRMLPLAAAHPGLAVVVWQGADHPDRPFDDGVLPLREHVVAAAYRDAADRAGPVLAADVTGLQQALPGRDVTVLGHSYGGSIVGSAEVHGMVVDRVVHVASAGAFARDLSEYAAPPGRTLRFSLTAEDDSIRLAQGYDADDASDRLRAMGPRVLDPVDPLWAPVVAGAATRLLGDPQQVGHGLDPDLLPGVVRLDPGVHASGRPVRGHSGVFDPGSTSWLDLLGVMTKGRVRVLDPGEWSSHLEPLSAHALPHLVVDRSPWTGAGTGDGAGDPRPGFPGRVLDLTDPRPAPATGAGGAP